MVPGLKSQRRALIILVQTSIYQFPRKVQLGDRDNGMASKGMTFHKILPFLCFLILIDFSTYSLLLPDSVYQSNKENPEHNQKRNLNELLPFLNSQNTP